MLLFELFLLWLWDILLRFIRMQNCYFLFNILYWLFSKGGPGRKAIIRSTELRSFGNY